MTPPKFDQAQEKTIARLEAAVESLTLEIKSLHLTLSNHMASQGVRCEGNTGLLNRHESVLMGDGRNEGLGTRVSSLSLQVKLIMGVLSAVSTATFGMTIHLLMKGMGG